MKVRKRELTANVSDHELTRSNYIVTWDMVSEYCALMILIIILAYEDKGSSIPSFKNRIFRGCLIVTLLSIGSNIISTAMIENLSIYPIALTRFVTTLYFLFTPIMG